MSNMSKPKLNARRRLSLAAFSKNTTRSEASIELKSESKISNPKNIFKKEEKTSDSEFISAFGGHVERDSQDDKENDSANLMSSPQKVSAWEGFQSKVAEITNFFANF